MNKSISKAAAKIRILYAIQGTGNGHLSRAIEIVPAFQKKAHVDILLSGIQSDIELPFPVKYRMQGMSFIFGKKGGVDILQTYLQSKSIRFLSEIKNLPVDEYDLVITDFEPVSAWAAQLRGIPSVGLSNQVSSLIPEAPKPDHKDMVGKFILENYAPVHSKIGFHFKSFNKNIFTPVIRKQVRELKVSEKEHFTVYLPAHKDEKIIKYLGMYTKTKWQVFSKHLKKGAYQVKNISIQPINSELFLESLASCRGIITAAGFGTSSEALFLGKKLLVIPMKRQYEQQCNAAALKDIGVSVMKRLNKKHIPTLEKWLKEAKPVQVNYPDNTDEIVDKILGLFASGAIIPAEKAIPKFQKTE